MCCSLDWIWKEVMKEKSKFTDIDFCGLDECKNLDLEILKES